ncbi:MAG TPA: hypothetical protein VGB73_07650 [Pyrinomonadaceae bacterium]
MSNDKPSPRRKKYSIESVRVTPQDDASVKRVLGRMMGRVPLDVEQDSSSGTTNKTGSTGTTNETGITNLSGTTSTTKLTGSTNKTNNTLPSAAKSVNKKAVAPERDFQRVPNSVTREAMAARLFKGKSKQVWDYLWSVSRGAVVPNRTVRRSRPQIKVGAGLGSMGTVDTAIEHLQNVGLILVKTIVGENNGNEYEVFTPEEVAEGLFGTTNLTGSTSSAGTTNESGSTQKLVVPVLPKTGSTSSTLSADDSTIYEGSNTSFKTIEKTDDDEAYAGFASAMNRAAKELTGKSPSRADAPRWQELAEVLIAELRIAAARTTVSSVPAFLAEHLRRRLWKIDRKQAQAEGRELPDESKDSGAEDQATDCPDCLGSGWWYPNGLEKGVLKCRHDRVKRASKEETV